MVKNIGKVFLIMMLLNLIFCLCSCGLRESYKEFYIVHVTECNEEDYISSDKLEFARIMGVTIIPEIKEINHGEYIIYTSAYSRAMANIRIKKLTLLNDGKIMIENTEGQELSVDLNHNNVFDGWVTASIFTEEQLQIHDGDAFDLILQIEINTNGNTYIKDISYLVKVKGYKSYVTPV